MEGNVWNVALIFRISWSMDVVESEAECWLLVGSHVVDGVCKVQAAAPIEGRCRIFHL